MKKEKRVNRVFAMLAIIVVILIAIKIYNDKQPIYHDMPLEGSGDIQIAFSKPSPPVQPSDSSVDDRFYADIPTDDIDNGIFYEPKNKTIDKGFLMEAN